MASTASTSGWVTATAKKPGKAKKAEVYPSMLPSLTEYV
jgi:hypothetical protein